MASPSHPDASLPHVRTDVGLVTDGADTGPFPVSEPLGSAKGVPEPWKYMDVGNVGQAGSTEHAGGVFTVRGSGADMWHGSDGMHFVYQPITGDFEISARVTKLQNTNASARAGVMFRETLESGARGLYVVLRPTLESQAVFRPVARQNYIPRPGPFGPNVHVPYWVKASRTGGTINAYVSPDGQAWKLVRTADVTYNDTLYVGLIVNGHNDSALCTSVFDNVALTKLPTGAAIGTTCGTGLPCKTEGSWCTYVCGMSPIRDTNCTCREGRYQCGGCEL